MSEESRQPARPPGQRRGDGAPAWWSLLDRGDLPADERMTPAAWPATHADTNGSPRSKPRWHGWLFNALAVLVALGVIMLGLGVDSARGALTVGLIFGVPMLIVAVTITVAYRRGR